MANTVDWGMLKANGDARRVPLLLATLRQDDRFVRDDAWRELVDLVHHQGDIYESTVATISALLEMKAVSTELWTQILSFLAGPAEYIECPGELGVQLRQAICDGHPRFVDALRADDEATREVAAFILGNIPERSVESTPALVSMIGTEREEAPLALAVWALGNLQSSPMTESFAQLSHQLPLPLPRAVASAFLAYWQGPNVPEEHTRAVADAVFHRRADRTRLPFGFLTDSLQSPLGNDLLQQIHSRRYVSPRPT